MEESVTCSGWDVGSFWCFNIATVFEHPGWNLHLFSRFKGAFNLYLIDEQCFLNTCNWCCLKKMKD